MGTVHNMAINTHTHTHTHTYKGKIIPVHDMKHTEGAEVSAHSVLTSEQDGGVWLTSHPRCFTPQQRPLEPTEYKAKLAPGQDVSEKKKSLTPSRNQPWIV